MVVGIGEAGVTGASFSFCDSADFLYLPASWWIADNKIPSLVADWHLLEAAYTGAAQQGYVDGVLKTTKDYPLNTSDKEVVIGLVGANRDQNYALESNGDFAELLIYNRELSVSEREQVEAYLHEKWFGTKLLSAQSPLVWREPGMSNLTGFSYSKATGQFLLSQSENGQVSLWRYDPPAAQPDRLTRLVDAKALYGAQWMGANRYAYGSRQPKQGGIVLAGPPRPENTRLFQGGNIDWFEVSPNGAKLLILGTVSNEPAAGIWQYDLASGQLQAAVAGSSHPSPYAESLRPFHGQFRLRSDRTVDCTIYPPSHFDHRKKYPLVLGNTFFGDELYRFQGPLWAPALASGGAYVVIINRGTWWGDIELWQENVMGVYHALADDPCIDTRQVYLFAASAETAYLDECATKNPGLWKGLILLNPGDLPDFSKSPMFSARPKILISAGSEEHEEARLKGYQADALSYGVLVDYIVHPGEPHHLVGNAAQLERTQAMMHFVFEE